MEANGGWCVGVGLGWGLGREVVRGGGDEYGMAWDVGEE